MLTAGRALGRPSIPPVWYEVPAYYKGDPDTVSGPDDVIEWIKTFAAAGVDYFICRFGSLDQFGQVERLARDVLPSFETAAARATA